MKTSIQPIISLENEDDLCFEAKKTCDNNGPPYTFPLSKTYASLALVLFAHYVRYLQTHVYRWF